MIPIYTAPNLTEPNCHFYFPASVVFISGPIFCKIYISLIDS